MYLTAEQDTQIRTLGRNLEIHTGVEFLAAVVGKCDTYPEIPWKAFALGATLSALVVVIKQFMQPAWPTDWASLFALAWVLGCGALFALLTAFWPALARLFLDSRRAEEESRQYAQGLYVEQALFRTRGRTAILLLIGLFERRVVLLPDSGIQSRLKPGQLEAVIRQMIPPLRQGNPFQALRTGIGVLEAILLDAGFKSQSGVLDQIHDELIEQKGADS